MYLATLQGLYALFVTQQKFTIDQAADKIQIKRTVCAISADSESFKTLR
jgi:hypothetical protein